MKPTAILLSASAVVMGALGIAATFAPREIAEALAPGSGASYAIVIQLLGALLFGFAMVNWTARGSLIGGIYNRPIAVGNVAHFLIGALALGKAVAAGERRPALLLVTALYVLFAVGFSLVLLRSPVERKV